MTSPDPDIELLTDDFIRRFRLGENPSIEDYARRYPSIASEIVDVLASIEMMEQLSRCEVDYREQANGTRAANRGTSSKRLGEFDIVREIGRGGMGVVFEAVDRALQRRVALKVLNDSTLATQKHIDRFHRESRLAAQLHHTNIVSVFGVGEENGTHFYAMQYVQGVSLQEIILGLRHLDEAGDNERYDSRAKLSGSADDARLVARAMLLGRFAESRDVDAHKDSEQSTSDEGGLNPIVDDNDTVGSAFDQTLDISNSKHDEGNSPDSSKPSWESDALPQQQFVVPAPDTAAGKNLRLGPNLRLGTAYFESVARIGVQVARALHYAHTNGILHRDVKPANLLFDAKGTVWVADFGLAKLAEHDDLTRTGDVVGTLKYMAPEQLAGQADARSDVHALGQTLYELLSLRPTCDGESYRDLVAQKQAACYTPLRKVHASIPRDLETIVHKSLDDQPAKRYQSAKELAEDLQRFLDDRPITARRVTSAEHVWRWCRRNRALAAFAAVASSLLILLPIVLGWAYVREADQKQQTQRTLNVALEGFDELFRAFLGNESATAAALSDTSEGDVENLAPAMITKDTARVLERMLVFYDRLSAENHSNSGGELAVESARARRRVGDLYQRLGQYTQSMEAYRDAADRYKDLSITNGAHRLEVARISHAIGEIYAQQQQFSLAKKEHYKAFQLLSQMPTERSVRYELARTHYLLGKQYPFERQRGPSGPAPRPHKKKGRKDARSIEQTEDLLLGPERETDLTADNIKRVDHLLQAIKILEDLRHNDSDDADYRFLLALCLREEDSPSVFLDKPNSPRARAAVLLEELAAQYPQIPKYRFELSETYRDTAKTRGHRSSSRALIEQLEYARRLAEQLVEEQREIASYRINLAHIYAHLGVHCGNIGDFKSAEEFTLKSIATHESVVEDFPGLAALSAKLSRHDKMRLGSWRLQLKRWEEVIDLLQPMGVTLESQLESEVDEKSVHRIESDLHQCGELLIPAYRATDDHAGMLVALAWQVVPGEGEVARGDDSGPPSQGARSLRPGGPGFGPPGRRPDFSADRPPVPPPGRRGSREFGGARRGEMGPPPGPRDTVSRIEKTLSYDENEDQQLTRSEVPPRMADEWFSRADRNANGKIDHKELRDLFRDRP